MEAVPDAVRVRGAYKAYGSGKRQTVVLEGLNMTVPTGVIYGLLGASGSGKTTLLSAVAGLRPLDAGEMSVLGSPPFTGPAIGFMPQDISLMVDFSISNTIYFFGRIMGMTSEEIRVRLDVLSKLLDLPANNKFVGNLSGGQQRRVSLAVAMLHNPELLILDEPTVGLDPILRNRIWDYLVQMTRSEGKTIIITTHYIEEARQSDMVGLMRGGQLLAEASPESILAMHECSSLEEAFLILSEQQHARLESGNPPAMFQSIGEPASLQQREEFSSTLVTQVMYSNVNEAREAVRRGKSWGVIHLGENFTEALRDRERLGKDATDETLNQSEIAIQLDMSDGQIASVLTTELQKAFINFFEEILTSCDVNVKHGQIPLRINTPVYGSKEYKFLLAIMPGTLITIVYFLGVALTSFAVLADRLEGIWDRTVVAGATGYELLASHGILQTIVVLVQATETIIISFIIFKVENFGSLWIVSLIVCLEGICGMVFGLLISVLCKDVRSADIISMGSVVPVYMICGVLWPVEGIPTPLRQISNLLPVTRGVHALRMVMGQGQGISNVVVLQGIAAVIIWCIIGLVLCMVQILRSNKR
ncbi:hypothetical protein B566_EDAN009653 [Ephemera danica]|nr:hypothetical protein B566_EDAN009653 [Ephemera danica]